MDTDNKMYSIVSERNVCGPEVRPHRHHARQVTDNAHSSIINTQLIKISSYVKRPVKQSVVFTRYSSYGFKVCRKLPYTMFYKFHSNHNKEIFFANWLRFDRVIIIFPSPVFLETAHYVI